MKSPFPKRALAAGVTGGATAIRPDHSIPCLGVTIDIIKCEIDIEDNDHFDAAVYTGGLDSFGSSGDEQSDRHEGMALINEVGRRQFKTGGLFWNSTARRPELGQGDVIFLMVIFRKKAVGYPLKSTKEIWRPSHDRPQDRQIETGSH